MNKHFLQLALAAIALLFGTAAFAQTSTTFNNDAKVPQVAPGGTVVFEDQLVIDGANALAEGDQVILLLPEGVVFSGTPTATATSAGTLDLQLETNGAGDPGASGLVTITDRDGNTGGLAERAVVTVADASAGGDDTILFKGSITYNGTSTTGNLLAQIIVRDASSTPSGAVLLNDVDNILAAKSTSAKTAAPIALATTTAEVLPNATSGADTKVLTPSKTGHLLTIPAGTKATDTITITLGSGLEFTTTTAVKVKPLTDFAPRLNPAALANKSTLVLTPAATSTRTSQYLLTIDGFETTALSTPGAVTVTLSGGAAGSATVAQLKNAGTSVALPTTVPATTPATVVIGASAAATLPNFEISGVFAGDYGDFTGGETITVTPPTGMTLVGAGTATCTGGALTTGIATNVLTLTFTADCAAGAKIVVSGVTATLASTASIGSKALTLAGSDTNFSDNITVVAASGVARGAVTLTGPTTLTKAGPGTTPAAAVITLTESTYGALANATTFPFLQFAPSANATITGVTSSTNGGAIKGLQVLNGAAAVPADGTYVANIVSESSSKILSTDAVTFTITYSVKSTATVGDKVSFTVTSDAANSVSTTIDVADVTLNTVSSRATGTAVPDLAVSGDEQAAGTLQIKEQFATALTTARKIRLVAPNGITFGPTQPATGTAPAGLAGATLRTTFLANDTLELTVTATGAVDTLTYTPSVIVSGFAAAGKAQFSLVDGDITGATATKAGITAETVNLVYVGDLASVDAGADVTVAEGYSRTRTVAGGLAGYTVASSSEVVATAEISGTTVTITGVSAGTANITVTDDLGATDVIAVTVVAQGTIPAKTTSKSDGTVTDAVVSGGISTDGGVTFSDTVSVGDAIDIVGTIVPDSADVGEDAIVIVAVEAGGTITLVGSDGSLVAFDGVTVTAFDELTLAASNEVNVTGTLGGPITVTSDLVGTFNFYFGYALADGDGNIVFNSEPIEVTISE